MTEPQDPFEIPKQPPADVPPQPPPLLPPQPGYGAPPPPPPGYGPPPPGYGPPPPGYDAPPPGWGQPQYGGYPPASRGTNVLAIIALVCVIFCWPASIVLGVIARSQIKQRGEGGDGLALAAIIIGCVFGLITVLVIASGTFASNHNGY